MFESAVVAVIVALRFAMAVAAVPELDPATAVAEGMAEACDCCCCCCTLAWAEACDCC